MTKYIDKDTLVAEIRKRLLPVIRDKHYDEWEEGQDSERIAILAIIDTLEVKDADEEPTNNDLEKEINLWFDYGLPNNDELSDYIKETAKHFFELGVKVQK